MPTYLLSLLWFSMSQEQNIPTTCPLSNSLRGSYSLSLYYSPPLSKILFPLFSQLPSPPQTSGFGLGFGSGTILPLLLNPILLT